MPTYLTLQFRAPIDQPQPWPVVIEIDGPGFPQIVSGRPDSSHFVGLAHFAEPTTCLVLGSDLSATYDFASAGLDPAELVPSFVDIAGRGLFALPDVKLSGITALIGDEDSIAELRRREQIYRDALRN